ncbi:Protein of unknown function DUF58 [Lachnospiraceae bacterium]|nr:Protein of unknown function DUF58 [Lachnospiraceae bacterium]
MKNNRSKSDEKRIKISLNRHKRYIRFIIYMILLIASIIIVSNRGGAFSYVFFYGNVLYIPIAIFTIIHAVKAVRLSQEVRERMFRKGTVQSYKIHIENDSFLPLGSVSFVMSGVAADYKMDITDRLYSLFPHESIKIENELTCRYAGSYETGITAIEFRDPFKIVEVTYKVDTPLRVSVLPAVTDAAVEELSRAYESADVRTGNIIMNSDENYLGNDVRKYTPGDAVNTIHWKNYARTGDMYVRLPELKSSQMMSLIIIKADIDGSEESLKKRDFFLEYIVSIMNYFARNKKPLEIVYFDTDIRRCIIDNYESFQKAYYDVIKRIMSKPASDKEEGMADIRGSAASRKIVFREKDMVLCQN